MFGGQIMLNYKQTATLLIAGFGILVSTPIFAYEAKKLSEKYQSCIEKADGVTADMHDCISAELEFQDKRLNENYSDYLKDLSPERRKKLLEVQRAWIKYRDLKCGFFYDPDGGGTISGILAGSCVLDMTAERADELKKETY